MTTDARVAKIRHMLARAWEVGTGMRTQYMFEVADLLPDLLNSYERQREALVQAERALMHADSGFVGRNGVEAFAAVRAALKQKKE